MSLLESIKADRYIAQIRDDPNPTSPDAQKAYQKLGQLGTGVVPKIIDEMSSVDKLQAVQYVKLLRELIDNDSLPLVVRGLTNDNPRTVSGTTWALSSSRTYNVNRFLDLLGDEDVSVAAVMEILASHKDRLDTKNLLSQIYNLHPALKTAVFKLIGELATEELIPELTQQLNGTDPLVKTELIDILARFKRPEVLQVLTAYLADESKLLRQAALGGVAKLGGPDSVRLITAALFDPEADVVDKAVRVAIQLNHPETARYLIAALKAENGATRKAALDILNETATEEDLQTIFQTASADNEAARSRIVETLSKGKGDRILSALLKLCQNRDTAIREMAIEVLRHCADKRTVEHLVKATKSKDAWVGECAVRALTEIGDKRAIPALQDMLERGRLTATVLTALGKLGDSKLVDKLSSYLDSEDKPVLIAAIGAIAQLTDENHAQSFCARIQKFASNHDDSIVRAASQAISALGGQSTVELTNAAPRPDRLEATGTGTVQTLLVEGAKLNEAPQKGKVLDITALEPGDMIEDRYEFIKKIGKGAFGTVLLVEDVVVREQLILKFLNADVASDEGIMTRFVQELRYSRRITHENVIRIYDFLRLGGGYAISMEYFPSHTLSTELGKDEPIPPAQAVSWAIDIAAGMHVAHQQGIVHRDLKPANILIDDIGLLKVVDFGVAAAAKGGDKQLQLTKAGYVIGSPKYMAPEQILGKIVDQRADIYSLGVMLYEMLAGNPPYSRGDHMSVMYQHVQGKAEPLHKINSDIPKELSDIVAKAMKVDKSDRYETMEELREALAGVLTLLD